ncbi:iron ABC transporter permease [Streptomyces sp. NBC_00006]|uniref:FecCD family ABC transporter permease n=1 Tax=unclassified Streptomyces TaxID=2593676 RepID=UPI00224D08A3|nr:MULTISPECIES: iron chelate uptake ABC transporter family permease subunit [unclassified Streptomyces]MCX5536409.1 iron ABC transporter permease [Streptomyces sp. NBC_00006]
MSPPAPARPSTPAPPRARRASRRAWGWFACLAVAALLFLVSLGAGSRGIPLDGVWRALVHRDGTAESVIVWQLRMPRSLLACVVGSALGVAGVVMQAVTRNPLAEPGLVGVNAGASFAVVVAISAFGITRASGYVWFAFVGALAAASAVYGLTARNSRTGQHIRLVLAGAAMSATLGACTGVLTMFNSQAFDSYRFWVVGSLEDRGTAALVASAPFVALGIAIALPLGPSLNALALGEETSTALGLRTRTVRIAGFTAVMLLCGAATAAAGPIAFVGLVVPHALRMLLGPDVRWLLVYAIPVGAALVLVSDVVGRLIAPPGEIEAGIVTAFIGAPVLMWLVNRRKGVRL